MTPLSRAQRAERLMRRLLSDHDLPQPDDVIDDGDELTLLWHDRKLAIVIELDDVGAS